MYHKISTSCKLLQLLPLAILQFFSSLFSRRDSQFLGCWVVHVVHVRQKLKNRSIQVYLLHVYLGFGNFFQTVHSRTGTGYMYESYGYMFIHQYVHMGTHIQCKCKAYSRYMYQQRSTQQQYTQYSVTCSTYLHILHVCKLPVHIHTCSTYMYHMYIHTRTTYMT